MILWTGTGPNGERAGWGNCWLYAIPRVLRPGRVLLVCWSPRNTLVPHAMCAEARPGGAVRGSFLRFFTRGGIAVWEPPFWFGHAEGAEGLFVEEFIPFSPRTGLVGVLCSPFFRGYVRRRVMRSPNDTLTGTRPAWARTRNKPKE